MIANEAVVATVLKPLGSIKENAEKARGKVVARANSGEFSYTVRWGGDKIAVLISLAYLLIIIRKSIMRNNRLSTFSKMLSLVLGTLLLNSAYAHSVQGGGFINGLAHPVFGFDHLLAMVSVGILSVQIGGRAIWTVPCAFLAFMLAGGLLGIYKIPFPAVETGIATSVLALGLAIALAKRMPTIVAMLFVGIFGVFHGYAHGLEMPAVAEPALYATGFILSTASLHITGVVIGFISQKIPHGELVLRLLGGVIAIIGIYMLVNLLMPQS